MPHDNAIIFALNVCIYFKGIKMGEKSLNVGTIHNFQYSPILPKDLSFCLVSFPLARRTLFISCSIDLLAIGSLSFISPENFYTLFSYLKDILLIIEFCVGDCFLSVF